MSGASASSNVQKSCLDAPCDMVHKFATECVLLALDYITHRQGGIDMCEHSRLYMSDTSQPWGDQQLFREAAVVVRRAGQQVEYCRQHVDLFNKFEKTLCGMETRADSDCIAKKFTEDLMCNVFGYQPSAATWDEVVLSIVMTACFIRHMTDGKLCSQYMKSLLDGLQWVIKRLGDSKIKCLGGWMALCKHYEVCPCAQPSTPCAKKETVRVAEAEPCMQKTALDVMNCYADLMTTDNCAKKEAESPAPVIGHSGLSVAAEGREIALDFIQHFLNMNLSYLSNVSCELSPVLERRMCLMRKYAECNCVAGQVVADHTSQLTCLFHSFKNNDLLKIKLQEYFVCNVLSKLPHIGWSAVMALFMLSRSLIQTARCENVGNTQDLFLCIIDGMYGALRCSETMISNCLRGWVGFEEQGKMNCL